VLPVENRLEADQIGGFGSGGCLCARRTARLRPRDSCLRLWQVIVSRAMQCGAGTAAGLTMIPMSCLDDVVRGSSGVRGSKKEMRRDLRRQPMPELGHQVHGKSRKQYLCPVTNLTQFRGERARAAERSCTSQADTQGRLEGKCRCNIDWTEFSSPHRRTGLAGLRAGYVISISCSQG